MAMTASPGLTETMVTPSAADWGVPPPMRSPKVSRMAASAFPRVMAAL